MCGLFGSVSSLLDSEDIESVKLLGIMSQLRGEDSTGICTVFNKKKKKIKWAVHKELGDSTQFFKKEQVRTILRKPNTSIVMGHTRYTTSGAVNLHNAHPISEKHITGCHNGVISKLDPKAEDREHTSDSRELFKILADKGLEEAIEVAKYGSMALTWIDKQARTFNLFTNEGRDLYLTNDKNHTTYLYASEKRFLDFTLDRQRLKDWAEPYKVEEFVLYSWHIGSTKLTVKKLEKPVVRYTPYVYRSTSYPLTDLYPWRNEQEEQQRWENRIQKCDDYSWCNICWESADECLCQPPGSISGLDERLYAWYAGQKSPAYVIKPMLESGCFNCMRQFRLEDPVYWPHWDYYLCQECASSEFYREALKHNTVYLGGLVG